MSNSKYQPVDAAQIPRFSDIATFLRAPRFDPDAEIVFRDILEKFGVRDVHAVVNDLLGRGIVLILDSSQDCVDLLVVTHGLSL